MCSAMRSNGLRPLFGGRMMPRVLVRGKSTIDRVCRDRPVTLATTSSAFATDGHLFVTLLSASAACQGRMKSAIVQEAKQFVHMDVQVRQPVFVRSLAALPPLILLESHARLDIRCAMRCEKDEPWCTERLRVVGESLGYLSWGIPRSNASSNPLRVFARATYTGS